MSPRLPNDPDSRLAPYRATRDPTRTPEPFGGQVLSVGSAFVVQHHAARRLHWDLRLEHEGALLSWAVPKGPSPSQADKRLAVRTEDHPLEYAEFESAIPQGEYGAGAMIVWDRGVWVPQEDSGEGLEKGKLLFELHLARSDGDDLRYAGSVGSGFSQRDLADIGGVLEEGEVAASPCTDGPVPDGPGHHRVAPWMLRYLRDRPLVMTRYPDGIDGKSFFQEDAAPHAPDWIRALNVWSEGPERELSYFVADDVDALLYVVNLGTIPIHVWSSRAGSLDHPDWCVLDLDPKKAPFEDVLAVALELRALCDEIGLPSYPKTSGCSGMHVLIPLARRLDHDQSRTLAELLGRVVATRRPDIATLTRAPGRREGKVYLDFVQNGHGRLIAAPFTVRPGLALADFTIRTVSEHMEWLDRDRLAPVLDEEPDLMSVLAKLGELVG